MADRTVEQRTANLRITLRGDPDAIRYAVRDAGLADERVDINPPMDEDDEADGNIDLTSLAELAAVLRHMKPESVKESIIWVSIGDPRSDPVWVEVGMSGGGRSLRSGGTPNTPLSWATVRIRRDLLAAELSDRIKRAVTVLSGRATD